MKPATTGITVESTVQGEAIAMRIDTAALAHIMGVLTDLYADRLLAAIREPSTNARDAQLAAGKGDEPIVVDLPTSLRPLLSIRDHGTGMSADDIREVFSAYGASTKRDTDDYNGMLGLGCKAPLAYTDQFVVTSTKDGERIVVSVARAEDGTGAMTVLPGGGVTNDPNGTQIDIPIKSGDSAICEAKAREFFSYWDEGTVILNNERPARVEGEAVGDQFLIVKDQSNVYVNHRSDHMRMFVVMGGVRYPLPDGYLNPALKALPSGRTLIAFVPIGTVMFTPSREGLQDTPQTIAALDGVMAAYSAELAEVLQATVTEAENPWSAAKAITDAKRKYGFVPPMEYEGRAIPDSVEFDEGTNVYRGGRNGFHGFKLETQGYLRNVSLADALASDVIWITQFTNKAWTQPMRRKLNRYVEVELGMEGNNYVLITDADDVPARDWLGDATVIKWADVKEWKDPDKARAASGSVKYAGTYPTLPARDKDAPTDSHTYYSETWDASALQASDAPIYYYANMKHNHYGRGAQELLGRSNICFIPHHRLAKFRKLFPQAREVGPAIQHKLAADWKRMSNDNRGAVLHGQFLKDNFPLLLHLKADTLDDADLRRLTRVAQHTVADPTKKKWETWWAYMPPALKEAVGTIDTAAVDKYALFSHIVPPYGQSKLDAAHLTMYLNAAYAAETEA